MQPVGAEIGAQLVAVVGERRPQVDPLGLHRGSELTQVDVDVFDAGGVVLGPGKDGLHEDPRIRQLVMQAPDDGFAPTHDLLARATPRARL